MQPDRDYTQARAYAGCYSNMKTKDPYENERVKGYDRLLHRTLSKILRERCPSIGQTKSIIMPILEQEPLIRGRFSKEELDKLSLLWIAVLGCFQDSAELLVRSGADVNEFHGSPVAYFAQQLELHETSTVFHALLQMYPSAWCDRLIGLVMDHGADLRPQDSYGRTVLHWAVMKGRVQMSKTLLEKGADVNAVAGTRGSTPLLLAASSSKADDLLPLFMKHGADVFAKSDGGYNALHHLAKAPDDVKHAADLARVLIQKGVSLDDRDDYYKQCPIHLAIRRNGENKWLIKTFLEEGADVNVADVKGKTPLLLAASSSKADELLPLVLHYGADVSAKDNEGHNALHYLALAPGEQVEMARLLIEKGVPLYGRCYDKRDQPIHPAAENGKSELIKLYLDHGADVNALGKDGRFPLLLAAKHDNPEALKTLLGRGANVHLSLGGNTALHVACGANNNREQKARLLLSAGANLLAEDQFGYTPLCEAACQMVYHGRPLTVELMVKELAVKKNFLLPSVQLKDERWIVLVPKLWNDYQDCINVYIPRMKFARFIKSCTFFDLLTKSHSRIAALMRNPDFQANFGLYDLSGFSMYAEDIRRAFKRAQYHHNSMLEQEDVINEAVYYILPHVVVNKVVRYIFNDTYCCLDMID